MKGAQTRNANQLDMLMFAAWRGAWLSRVDPKKFPKTFDDLMDREKPAPTGRQLQAKIASWVRGVPADLRM